MPKHPNFKIGLFFLALSVVFALFIVPTVGEDWRKTAGADVAFFTVGPRFFPYLSAAIMAVLSVLMMIESALQATYGADAPPSTIPWDHLKPVLVFMTIGTVYILSLSSVGTLIATPLCLIACFRYFDLRQWRWILLLAFGITAMVYLCFEKLMMVPLPRGFLDM